MKSLQMMKKYKEEKEMKDKVNKMIRYLMQESMNECAFKGFPESYKKVSRKLKENYSKAWARWNEEWKKSKCDVVFNDDSKYWKDNG